MIAGAFRKFVVPPVLALTLATLAPVVARAGEDPTFLPVQIPIGGFLPHFAVADVTGDGREDLIVGESGSCSVGCRLRVLPQTAFGLLGPAVSYPAPRAEELAVGDFDDDGLTDVVVGDGQLLQFYFQTPGGALVPGLARGAFQPAATFASADLDRDGRDDLAALRALEFAPAPHFVDVYAQGPGGRFTTASFDLVGIESCSFCRLQTADLDRDERPDLFWIDEAARLQILYQESDGGFAQTTLEREEIGFQPYWLAPGQFDDDPAPEIAAIGIPLDPGAPGVPRFPLYILDRGASGQWRVQRTVSLEQGFHQLTAEDLDGNGRSDIVGITFAGVGSHQARIYLQSDDGAFRLSQQFDLPWGNYQGRNLAVRDLNGNGKLDVAVLSDNFGPVLLLQQGTGPGAPAPELFPAATPGFAFTVRIAAGGTSSAGSLEPSCIPETACVSGAVAGRSEVFLRMVGPKGNGRIWPTIVKFTTSRVDVWVYQLASGEIRHYRLAGAKPGEDLLPGLFDRDGFAPTPAAPAGAPLQAGPAAAPPPPAGSSWIVRGDFRIRARITAGDATQSVRQEIACIEETLCLSGAIPGRSEVFVRLVGPKPNGYLWPTIVKFTTSRVEVWIEQISRGTIRYYELEAAAPGQDRLDGLFDRNGFQ